MSVQLVVKGIKQNKLIDKENSSMHIYLISRYDIWYDISYDLIAVIVSAHTIEYNKLLTGYPGSMIWFIQRKDIHNYKKGTPELI